MFYEAPAAQKVENKKDQFFFVLQNDIRLQT
jgi:hypothetical protein